MKLSHCLRSGFCVLRMHVPYPGGYLTGCDVLSVPSHTRSFPWPMDPVSQPPIKSSLSHVGYLGGVYSCHAPGADLVDQLGLCSANRIGLIV